MRRFFKYALTLLLMVAGLNHFLNPSIYSNIMPSYLPWHRFLVYLSGLLELLLGILLLIPAFSRLAAWGIILVLIGVFPANINMALHPEDFNVPPWLLWLRLPLQIALILWAFVYTLKPLKHPKL